VNDPVVQAAKIPGMMESDELAWLFEVARRMESIIELGSYKGRSTYVLCAGCPGQVHAVDCFWCGQMYPYNDSEQYTFPEFMANVGHFPNLKSFEGLFRDAVNNPLIPPKVDMIFIDGDHAYASVLDDLKTWTPRARRMICGHDLAPGTPGVQQALDEFFGPGKVQTGPGSLWYVDLI
jgi:Methyltransferase domain